MQLSGRNQLEAVVVSVKLGGVMAEVVVRLNGGEEVVAAITAMSARELGLEPGNLVVAVIKSTDVMVATA